MGQKRIEDKSGNNIVNDMLGMTMGLRPIAKA